MLIVNFFSLSLFSLFIPFILDKYIGCEETLGKRQRSVRYEIGAVTITWWTRASLARFNLVNARRSHFGTTTSLSTWFQCKCWHFKVRLFIPVYRSIYTHFKSMFILHFLHEKETKNRNYEIFHKVLLIGANNSNNNNNRGAKFIFCL